ncbi:uncharacterized protein LOC114539569 [Dendronephthya gigantea]|uniref:uncharacterized protein LOC114539569 n=1 Tax=Dendronephthya gigantea TaxID=151771 RepID=UPI00106D9B23|nr:uncharacterized protein LOC114539569 [Dendronephthya gigantea]
MAESEEARTSHLPERSPTFTARESEIQKVISFLNDKETAVVSLYGRPGFGKTAIAVELAHQLNEDHKILVIFSRFTTSVSEDEMILQLCCDVGINQENDPKSSLALWLRSIYNKVIFVLDNVDNLLAFFYELIRFLRNHSNQHCQMITTSRMSYQIPGHSIAKVQVSEMDNESCIALLQKMCPSHEMDDIFLQELAELCGQVPLAMCIAGTRVQDFENSDDLLRQLKNDPLEALQSPDGDQFVTRAVKMSYEMLGNEQRIILARLTVFDAGFDDMAAKVVINERNLDIEEILKNFVCRRLIKLACGHYSIHPLIKRFLMGRLGEQDKKCAQALMVGHYLALGHNLTMQSYSKDGYKVNREALKREAHQIQNVLKICCNQRDSDIIVCLTRSEIYTTSARLFFIFIRTVIPENIVDKFLQLCADLAEQRKEYAIKIDFDCLIAAQKRRQSTFTPDVYNEMFEKIKEDFERLGDVEENLSVRAHFFYQHGRYLSFKAENCTFDERPKFLAEARHQLERSFEIREMLTETTVEKADKIFSALHLGNIWKKIAKSEFCNFRQESSESPKKAEKNYKEALQLSLNNLGEHELTSACYKNLGDFYLLLRVNEKAIEMYTNAKRIRENLDLEASGKHVNLLSNYGKCLIRVRRVEEAIVHLEIARNIAEKLAINDEPNQCKAKIYTSLAIAYKEARGMNSEEAVSCAKKARDFDGIIRVVKEYEYNIIQQIVQNNLQTA